MDPNPKVALQEEDLARERLLLEAQVALGGTWVTEGGLRDVDVDVDVCSFRD